MADAFGSEIAPGVLPDDKMYYNIAKRIIGPSLQYNYDLVGDYARDVQTLLNEQAGLSIKGIKPEINQDRIAGIINKISDYETIDQGKWLLDEPVVNFSQSVVDDTIKANADFQYKAGLKPKIIRTEAGNCCDWCKGLAGVYAYPDVPKDVYRRYRFCRCTVDYYPGDGKKQDVWSKKWKDPDKDDKIRERKSLNEKYTRVSGAKNYFRDESEDSVLDKEFVRKEKHAYREYDRIKNSNQELEKRKIFNNIAQFKIMHSFSKEDVDIAFDHVFNDLHEFESGKKLFYPEYDMAQSWNRLINQPENIQAHDLVLLKHERLEHDMMYKDGLNYREAHDKTSEVYLYAPPKKKG